MPVKKTTRSTTSAAPAKKVAKETSAKKAPAKKRVTKKVAAKKSPAKKVAPKKNEPYVPSRLASAYSTDISKGKHLVIVESPAKAKTIGWFLGKGVEVLASYGHVSDLPQKTMWVDIKNNFEPTYEIAAEKKKVIAELRKRAKEADGVWLATDEDREGEAIARHVAQALWLDLQKTPRIVFHEITKEAIQKAVQSPRYIDMNLVDAQQARRILDRIVGFSISPVLWIKIKRWLSAWRVQSVAVKLIIEREREIQAFKPEESWKIFADITYQNYTLRTTLAKIGKDEAELRSIDDVQAILEQYAISDIASVIKTDEKNWSQTCTIEHKHIFQLHDIIVKNGKKNPSAPFITSSLQQEASRRFGRGVKQVMSVAQRLYEAWFITYMRTDSTNLSGLAIAAAKWFITKTYGEKYHQVRQFASKSKNAQEAHEAIRPTYIDRTPDQSGLAAQELMLYRLIWLRTVASQMASAEVENTTYDFMPAGLDHHWTITGEVITFDGFLVLYEKQKSDTTKEDDDIADDEQDAILPKIAKGTNCDANVFEAVQFFTKPPSRYTESALVKALESRGIGRPSTYAPTISTIQDRGYIEKKEDKKLYPFEIAFHVNDFLDIHFKHMMNYEFTAKMEDLLDEIADGGITRQNMMKNFYTEFDKEVQEAKQWEKAVMFVWRNCPKCKEWNLIYKFTKFGKFIGCDKYPECDYTEKTKEESDKLAPLKEKYEGQPCPEWGTIVVKMWRFWPFLTSSLYPEVKWISWIPDDAKIALEKEFGGKECPECGKWKLVIKKARRGNYFLACDRYPECKHAENIPGQPSTGGGGWKRFAKKKIAKKK
jgi:DNA topoisomerase I